MIELPDGSRFVRSAIIGVSYDYFGDKIVGCKVHLSSGRSHTVPLRRGTHEKLRDKIVAVWEAER